jgi:hypothetical protein
MAASRLSDITDIQVYCLPNNLTAETMYFNRVKETTFVLAFDLLHGIPTIQLQQCLSIACTFQYKGQYLMSETCLIEWGNEKDLTWFSK